MLNKYIWELYIKSGGEKTVKFFENAFSAKLTEAYAEDIYRFQEYYCVTKEILRNTKEQLLFLTAMLMKDPPAPDEVIMDYLQDGVLEEEDAISDIDNIFGEWYRIWNEENETDKGVFTSFSNSLAWYSTLLAVFNPGLFVPYYFFSNYNVLTMIADAFDIRLPEIPKKADYKARVWHFANLCKSFYHFRRENNLSFYELCAFLYDFAPHYIGGIESYIIQDLPSPKAAYFIGGGGDNSDAEAENNPDEITRWQCNPDTRAGDMIVMYLRFPISAISSIWRSCSVGFIDPFFYYYRCTFIGRPQKVKRISLADIKIDQVLCKMPIVAKNMQGINGVELRPSEYNYIISRSNADAPRLEYSTGESDRSFANEKEVEEKLIKPLLKVLGYNESDYVQQMYIEIGNHNHALIPDFVLKPVNSGSHYSGFAIVEAKRSISNDKQLDAVKGQVRSYAKLLAARYAVIASMEKIWVTSAKDDYTSNIFEATWDALSDADVMFELEKIIGRRRADRE